MQDSNTPTPHNCIMYSVLDVGQNQMKKTELAVAQSMKNALKGQRGQKKWNCIPYECRKKKKLTELTKTRYVLNWCYALNRGWIMCSPTETVTHVGDNAAILPAPNTN